MTAIAAGDDAFAAPANADPVSASGRQPLIRGLTPRAADPRGPVRVYASRPMSQIDELDEYDAELELRLKREYADVFPLFRYCVLTQEATYLCNRLERQYEPQAAYPFFHVVMEDVWVWDKNRPTRIIPRVEIHTTQDITVEVLRADDEPVA